MKDDPSVIAARKADPASCRREPDADEVKIPIADFGWLAMASGWDKQNFYFGLRVKERHAGFNNIVMPRADYEEALQIADTNKLKINSK